MPVKASVAAEDGDYLLSSGDKEMLVRVRAKRVNMALENTKYATMTYEETEAVGTQHSTRGL